MTGKLERWFRLSERGSDVRTEVTAGVTTFLTMVYIAFVNPSILAEAGMPLGPVFVATCLGLGFITYVAIKVLAGRWRECPPMLLVVALVFAAKFIWL